MSNKDSSDSLDSLFADALKAVEKRDKSKQGKGKTKKSTSSNVEKLDDASLEIDMIDIDVEIEIGDEEDSSSSENASDINDEAYEALLEEKAHLDLQYQRLQERLQDLQTENGRLQQRLASAHTHMQSMIDQRKQARKVQETTQKEIDDAKQRIRMLEGTVERQKQQIEKNGAMRRKEKQELKKYGASSTLKQLLPALDSLDLAVQNRDADPESLRKGLRLLQSQFMDALNEAGVQRVSANPGDKFNPAHHEAVMRVPSEDIPTNHIVEAFCGAYTLHDRLLRAAMVSVAAPKK